MRFFGFGKKDNNYNIDEIKNLGEIKSIKVLGSGCTTCNSQFENVKNAVEKSGLDISLTYITDVSEIIEYGVMTTPCVVINDVVISEGRLLSCEDIEKILEK